MKNLNQKNSNQLDGVGFIRLREILQILPIGRSTFLEKVSKGIYPQPIKLTERTVGWVKSDIKALIDGFNKKEEDGGKDNAKK